MVDILSPDMHVTSANAVDELPIDAARMFADHKGVHKPRIEKKQRALLKKVGFLKEFIEDDEQLLAVTTAVSPTSFFQQWTTGFAYLYLQRCLLVFTNKRVFHIPSRTNFDYRQSVAQIRYGDVDSIVQKGSRLKVTYKSGAKDLFLYMRRAERKKIRAFLPSMDLQGATSDAGRRVHLCPQCTTELVPDVYECGNCTQEFKSQKEARKRSIWIPGGGYFYTGHPFLGIADAFIELILILAIVTSLIPSAGFPNGDFATAGIFALFLLAEKAITVYHANHYIKEYLVTNPEKAKSSPVKTTFKFIGGALVLIVVGLGVIGALMDAGVTPSERVLGPGELPADQYEVLLNEGIVGESETIEYFYSEGLWSVREGGSILTDYRVVTYEEDENDELIMWDAWNEDIRAITQTQKGDALNFSVYRITTDDEDNWFDLWLPHEYGDDERFADAVRAKIPE